MIDDWEFEIWNVVICAADELQSSSFKNPLVSQTTHPKPQNHEKYFNKLERPDYSGDIYHY
ncbi:MAG: hypothetical protein LBF88_04420 [Planctomycetaceae bacterium]|nr:hypothetical protein [Planctomycetaceae bacterium]